MKFSLIIPVYNTAEYLADCLNSCMNQHNLALGRDYEIICVNDGSTDDSARVLARFEGGGFALSTSRMRA